MSERIQAVRGMNDLLPENMRLWHRLESTLRSVGWQYGYEEIRTPLLEKTALFTQSIGDQTDIVDKEMYTFTDSGEERLSLRPEATASTVRACIQHGLLHNQQRRFWYMGPMFRRERPQKGRYRQFHQFGMEAFGWSGPDIDAEIIRAGERIWKELEIDGIQLEINTLGSSQSRLAYRDSLQQFLRKNLDQLDEDSLRRLDRNPLRILDSKNPDIQELISNAPNILDFIQVDEHRHFERLCESLEKSSINFSINTRLVRGLDYYTSTVFEWTTKQLGAQNTVCAGGRYDSLVEKRGGKPVPAIGFAMGMERLAELATAQGKGRGNPAHSIYVIDITGVEISGTVGISEALRDAGFVVVDHCGGGKLKTRLKRADQSGAEICIIVGETELEKEVVQVKFMRKGIDPLELPSSGLVQWCESNIR